MRGEGELWLLEVNEHVQRLGAKKTTALVKAHGECLKFVKEHITVHRLKSMKRITEVAKNEEQELREKQRFKRLLAFELLFHNLALLLMIPEMFEEIESDLEELKLCFGKLGLTTTAEKGSKRAKKEKKSENPEERQEALNVLFDLLIALLTKPQSFLREIANFTFKQMCTEIPPTALAHLIEIV